MTPERQRLLSLLDFAKEVAKLRIAPMWDVGKGLVFCEHEHSFQNTPGVHFNMNGREGEVWLKVDRLQEKPAPVPQNPLLAAWLSVPNTPWKEPFFKESLDYESFLNLELHDLSPSDDSLIAWADWQNKTELEANLAAYMETHWKPWAAQEKIRRKTIQLYGKLFTLKQQLEGSIQDAQIEIVWGIGIAVWNLDNSRRICAPLITQLVDITLNEDSFALEIAPRHMEPKLELDIYVACDNPGVASLEKMYAHAINNMSQPISPFSPSTFETILRSAVTSLDSQGVYWPTEISSHDRNVPPASSNLKVTDTWVLFARPRNKSLFLHDLDRFKAQIEKEETPISGPLYALLKEPTSTRQEVTFPSFRGVNFGGGNGGSREGKDQADLYFPLPFNEEQVKIIQMLERYDGVVVQGPPGTGKTHTIANIISHYFATGRRVLVTSMKEHALTVLRDKLPEDIRPLAISLFSNDQEGTKLFENAISKIASELQVINKSAYQREIAHLEESIHNLHGQLGLIDRKIADWGKKNLAPIQLGNESLSPTEATKKLMKGQGEYEWVEDRLSLDHSPLFDNIHISKLRKNRQEVGSDLIYVGVTLPEVISLPSLEDVLRLHEQLSQRTVIETSIQAGALPPLVDSNPETITTAVVLIEKIKRMMVLKRQINQEKDWPQKAEELLDFGDDSLKKILEIFESLGADIKEACEQGNTFLERPVQITENIDLEDDISQAIQNKIDGKLPFGFGGLVGKAASKKKLSEIRILNDSPQSEEDWQYVKTYIDLQKYGRDLLLRWNQIAGSLNVPLFDSATPALLKKALECFVIHKSILESKHLKKDIAEISQALFPQWKLAKENKVFTLEELQGFLENHVHLYNLTCSLKEKEGLLDRLSEYTGPIVFDLREFIKKELGDPNVMQHMVREKWQTFMDDLRRLHTLKNTLEDISSICSMIEKSGAPKWAHRLKTEPSMGTWDPLLPNNWKEVWKLRQLATYLGKKDARRELNSLTQERRKVEAQLAKKYGEIITKRTWLKLYENATPNIRNALEAFRTAISKIGKGTGRRAIGHRRSARQASEQANKAVPCWIMPHWRVSETLPSEVGCFDLVIIDEASQSDFSALPSLLRAKKMLIVGDDKQVSPEEGFTGIDKINALKARYLSNQIYQNQMDPKESIYDLFKVVFSQSKIMLQEHFRCAGPIIEYSKREFYDHELKPVRLPKYSERLDPPLIDVLVEDGYRSGDINLPEARFIVDEIKKICADERMKHRTIGVVSLLKNTQALRIWQMLEDELGPEEIKRHEIACGDARTFQGKERDIIFLSMVVCASNDRPQAQAGRAVGQRFNVAASRARDRMYLVRSIEADQLSMKDTFRKALLAHFKAPYPQDEQQTETLRDLCESDFELEVYDFLVEQGYHVTPQVKVGQFRIDMVVEGDNDARLAIECDGDQYHGPEQWENDMSRQRVLERVGWQFWRCLASDFVRDRADMLSDLVRALEECHITPTTKGVPLRSSYTDYWRVTTPAFLDDINSPQNEEDFIDQDTELFDD